MCWRKKAFSFSPQVLVEKSLKGWKEVEYEVVRGPVRQLHHGLQYGKLRPAGHSYG